MSGPSVQQLPGIRLVVAVASGKGGVGKSTVSVNVAVALARSGRRVGLLDADLYGPSLPLMLGATQLPPQRDAHQLEPVERFGVRVMSVGLMVSGEDPLLWRGPMLDKMVEHLLRGVRWGELDYLLVDLPPGTGDVQLSLCQKVSVTGAVVVSTPQDAAIKVAEKAVIMFRQLNSPVLGLVENMSHHVCRHCGKRDDVFPGQGTRGACERLGVPFLGEVPLDVAICEGGDAGIPVVESAPDSAPARAFFHIAQEIAGAIRPPLPPEPLPTSLRLPVIAATPARHEPQEVARISPQELKRRLESDEPVRLLDARAKEEWAASRIDGAICLTDEMVEGIVQSWPREIPLVVYCHLGKDSPSGAAFFAGHGFTNVRWLAGGIDAWSVEVDPSVRRYRLEFPDAR